MFSDFNLTNTVTVDGRVEYRGNVSTIMNSVQDKYYKEIPEIPYKTIPSNEARDEVFIVFSSHFITILRLVLSDTTGYEVSKFNTNELKLYYDYIEYLDNTLESTDSGLLEVLDALDTCITDITLCRTSDTLASYLDSSGSWYTCSEEEEV